MLALGEMVSQRFLVPLFEVRVLEGQPRSSVAQLVEQLTVNQLVAGSSPARGAKKFYPTLEIVLFISCKDLLNFNF